MTNTLAVAPNGHPGGNLAVDQHRGELSASDLETLRATVLKGASDAQLRMYARTCRSRGLDPFAKEIHGWAGRDGAVEIVVGIDGLRTLAEGSGEYRGQDGPWYCGQDKEWTEVWLGPGKPLASKVCVKREGMEPVCSVALLSECERNTPVWRTQLSTMLAIRAEAQAIRRLFPRQTTGLYAEGELPDPEEAETPVEPSRPAQAHVARPEVTPVHAEAVDAETGEIQPSKEELGAQIKRIRDLLGWTQDNVRSEAKKQSVDLRTIEGLSEMVEILKEYAASLFAPDEDHDAAAQGTLIDAETKPIEREY